MSYPIANGEISPHSQPTYWQTSNEPTDSPGCLLKRKPLIKPEKRPEEIIGDNGAILKAVLAGYQKVKFRTDWSDYAAKLDFSTRDTIAHILSECRRNGFFNPHIVNDRIIFEQMVASTRADRYPYTLCSICERACARKDVDGNFREVNGKWEGRREIKKCWE